MSEQCVAGYGWYDLDAHDVNVDPVADLKTMEMEAVPTYSDPAIPAPDAPNHETCVKV